MPGKILKYEYKFQGTDLCNPRKCTELIQLSKLIQYNEIK